MQKSCSTAIDRPRCSHFRRTNRKRLLNDGKAGNVMGAIRKATFLAMLMMMSGIAGCFGSDEDENTGEIVAVFTYSPATNIRVGQTIDFDARDSLPSGVALTYKWDFDGDNSIDATGRTADWSYAEVGEYTVELIVSDGSKSQSTSKTLTIVDASALPPSAEITSFSSEEDCEGEDVDEGNYIHVWICDFDKSNSDRNAAGEMNIELDASDSTSGSGDDYISKYHWDLDLEFDADGDGDSTNDNDLEGETVEWKDVVPGEYEVGLTITNGKGLTDSDDIKVHVSYAGYWLDFLMGGNNSGDPIELDFEFTVHYDQDIGNTIRKVVGELTYPKIDSDCTDITPGEGNNCRAKLDLHAFNEEDEEATNTSNTALDQRDDGNCNSDDNDCVHLTLSSYLFTDSESDSTYGDGEWTMKIRNNRVNDLQVESIVIRLVYK